MLAHGQAPEVLIGRHEDRHTVKADIWSYGVVGADASEPPMLFHATLCHLVVPLCSKRRPH